MKQTILAILTAAVTVATSQAQILVAGWDFQTTADGGTAVVAAPATGVANTTPKVYAANFGAGTLYLNGSNFSSDWFLPTTGTTNAELTSASGSNVNTVGTSLSTVTTSPASLSLLGGAGSGSTFAANGKSITFRFSMASLSNLDISFSSQRSGTGFSSITWAYSNNGGLNWNSIGLPINSGTVAGLITSSFSTSNILSLPTVTGLDGVSDALLRATFTGATGNTGSLRLDNIQLSAVPEPSSTALMALGAVGLVGLRAFGRKQG